MTSLKVLLGGASLAIALAAGPAYAGTVDWSLSGDGDTGSGSLTYNASGDITSFTGIIDGNLVSLLGGQPGSGGAVSPSGLFIYDNILYPTGSAPGVTSPSLLDNDGVLFSYAGGEGNIWGNGSSDYAFYTESAGSYVKQNGTGEVFAISAPEPATWMMLLSGFGLLGFMMRGSRRRQLSSVATA